MLKQTLFFLLFIQCTSAFASPGWYQGTINRIWPHEQGGGFILTFDAPSSLQDCKHAYVYFRSSSMQSEQLKTSFSLALASFHAGNTVGVVIDKSLNGEYCHAMSIDVRK